MTQHSAMKMFLTCWACLMMSASGQMQEPPIQDATAYMDRRDADAYGCGDTIRSTITGKVSSIIPAHDPSLNCTLTLYSPPGTRLSLTITYIRLASLNLNTCDGNRLKILGSNLEGATSLLPSFPNGLCGYAKPSQSIESADNQVYLLLETVETTVESQFSLTYTSFKTTLDDDCFACSVGDSRELPVPFCIDQRLLCDGVHNCPGNTEETSQNCQVTTISPTESGNTIVIIIVVGLGLILIAVLIFVILALVAKRAYSKQNRGSDRQPEMVRQSYPMTDDIDQGHHSMYTDQVALQFGLALGQYPHHPLDVGPMSADGGFQLSELPGAGPLPAAPPAYSTLPRAMEQSLEVARNTNPTPRSQSAGAIREEEPSSP